MARPLKHPNVPGESKEERRLRLKRLQGARYRKRLHANAAEHEAQKKKWRERHKERMEEAEESAFTVPQWEFTERGVIHRCVDYGRAKW